MTEMLRKPTWSADQLEDWMTAHVAKLTKVGRDDVDPDAPFTSLNLNSVDVLDLVVELEDLLGFEIQSTIAWDYPTIRLLAAYMATLVAEHAGSAPAGEA